MTLSQLHYTSAPPGPDGSGFRFTAVSDGVPQGVLREAEQLIGYEPPRDRPARPDAGELADFPTAFSFSELSDGGRLLSRSVYTGIDYSGRWGNFHAHACLLPAGARLPDGALPITAWESRRWTRTTPDGGRPEPIDRLEPSGLMQHDTLVAFAASRADRLAAVLADVRAVAKDPGAGQVVLVERDSAAVAQWIALACAALPREQAHRLTFTTYTRRPAQARQQVVGALPSSETVAYGHRHRVHDCTRPPAPADAGDPDPWAQVCALVWRAGRPDLFRHHGPDLGSLAAAALTAGIALPAAALAAATHWVRDRAGSLPEEELARFVTALCEVRPPDGTASGTEAVPSGAEAGTASDAASADGFADGLGALFARLDGQVPAAVTAPLAARVLDAAVRGDGPVPVVHGASFTPQVRMRLGKELGHAVRAGVADPARPPAGRPLGLLRVADLLDVDCTDLLPELAARLARSLMDLPEARVPVSAAGPDARTGAYTGPRTDGGWASRTAPAATAGRDGATPWWSTRSDPTAAGTGTGNGAGSGHGDDGGQGGGGPVDRQDLAALRDAVAEHPTLRIALFGALDAVAAARPVAAARMLAVADLPVRGHPGFPHLRMCASNALPTGVGDRLTAFHGVVRTAGVSAHAEPAVLRTALGLVWPGELPTGQEASLLLNQLGSDLHRAAGTRDLLIDAALAAPADDRDVPVLAADLLRCFTTELEPERRAALLLLEFAGLLGTEGEGLDWVRRAAALTVNARSLPAPVLERVHRALARRLLSGAVPPGELYALALSGDPALLAAYERAARSAPVGDRLRTVPHYVAECFCDWSSHAGTHPAWDETCAVLLAKVLRPIVRALPAENLTQVEADLARAGRGKLDAFRSWNRPGALGRLAGRFTGRGRGRGDGTDGGADSGTGSGTGSGSGSGRHDDPSSRYGDVAPPYDGGERR
ncbi:hypothetical protein QFZ75_001911 [Streptomyces sp. V3I8]|uniref:GTPase-associated protein 1-related protein n=1 Tax=Streptomyces sp. V3I8 TaxID=3042279 RepID=UPI00278899B3|nr:GTPase-associated protein 1-related protein [Streptomyces sp. V3I8]MDQ1035495.1 hypothetical protein [Streptomyces sp. V3I8]